MHRIELDTEAGQVSAELARRGVAGASRVRALIEVSEGDLPMATIARAGGGFDWLTDEPNFYSDADLLTPA